MTRRAHILPRKPLIARRPFGILTSGLGRADAAQRRAIAPVARHFRAPLRRAVAQVAVPAAPGPRLSSVHHITLAPRFEVMLRQYHAATERYFSSQVTTEVQTGEVSHTRMFRPVWTRPARLGLMQTSASAAPASPMGHSSAPGGVLHHHHSKQSFAQIAPTAHPARSHTAPWRAVMERLIAQPMPNAPSASRVATPHLTAISPASRHMQARAAGRAVLHTERRHRRIQVTTVASRYHMFHHGVGPVDSAVATREAAAQRPPLQSDAQETRVPREIRRTGEVHATGEATLGLPARTLRKTVATQSASADNKPVRRSFRAEAAAAPAAPLAPTPKAPQAAATQAPQIDIAALDKVLWQRFEKRLRIETERRGRG